MNAAMGLFRRQTVPEKVAGPLVRLPVRAIVVSGAAATVSLVAVSAASAATSALRRRAGQS